MTLKDAIRELLLDKTITTDLLDELFAAVVSEDKDKINKILSSTPKITI